MPRRKITIEEAFATLESAGINVQVKKPDVDELIPLDTTKAAINYSDTYGIPQETLGGKLVKVKLYAKHTVGSGGQSYGPGIITVPSSIAQHLLHQDGLAVEADNKMLDRQQHSYLVVQRQSAGQVVNVGLEVDSQVLDNIGNRPSHLMFNIR